MLNSLLERSSPVPGSPGVRGLEATSDTWHPMARDIAAGGARLLSLWVDRQPEKTAVVAAYLCDRAVLVIQARLPANEESYPGIADLFPCAARMQRAAADLTGIRASDPDSRPWLRHAAWPAAYFPLAAPTEDYRPAGTPTADQYPFVRVSGDGVHEIPVGPVHAGHHRARAFSLLDRRREGAQARGAPRLRSQRHRAAIHEDQAARGSSSRGARLGGFRSRVLVGVLPGTRGHVGSGRARPRAVVARARARKRAHRQPPRRSRRARQRCGVRLRASHSFRDSKSCGSASFRPRWGSAIYSISSFRAE